MPLTVHKAIDTRTLDSGNPAGFTTGTATTTPGLSKTLTVRLDNPNSVVLTGAAFTDSLPTGLVIATPPSATTTCAGGTVIAAAAGTSVRLAGASVPAGGSCIVSVDVLSNISGTYTNTIPAGGVTTVEGVSNAEPSSAALIVSTPPSIVKQFSPGVIPAGGRSTLTIVIGNQNASSITLSSEAVWLIPIAIWQASF
jgi:hypothetical protein